MKKLVVVIVCFINFWAFASNECYKKIDGEWVEVDCYILQLEEFRLKWEGNSSARLSDNQEKLLDNIVIPAFSLDEELGLSFKTYSKRNDNVNSLSERRVKAVVNYLISKGVNSKRLISTGHGESASGKEKITANLNDEDAVTVVNVHKKFMVPTNESFNENLRISKIESFRPEITKLSIDEKKLEHISFLSENRRQILSQCKEQYEPPTSHRKFNKIQLYAYEKIDGSVDLAFFNKLFSPKGKFDNLKISNLNGFYKPLECKCKIKNKEYTVGLAWFYGVISSLNINNKSGELKLSALDIISASVTLGRSTVSGKIYGEGLYNDEMNIDFDLSTFSVKEYSNYNIFVKDYLNLRKDIDSKKTTFSPSLILLELFELNN
ncbi:hypothetical protein [Maribacter polysiphoniae]|uniref:hypothetical protein n=1 Tax=Maribacter polysiphoniae TaxID=429344 RepID=UPI002355FBAA|nr:hypothetical protein [Maribacter polysiphoniae]